MSPRTEPPLLETPRSRLHRLPARGSFDRQLVYDILDQGLICHVSFAHEAHPVVLPMAYVRIDDRIYLHGSSKNRMLGVLASGAPACVAVTLLDGLVLARSQFHHSMNYRSVVVFGAAENITEPEQKQRVLATLTDHLAPGRSRESRPGSRQELAATLVLAVPIIEASAKCRTGPPLDASDDFELPHWSGVVPLALRVGTPLADPTLRAGAT
ncbi:MAG TPA: pyridoxamine 5'-phosphate oxidase family protein, partial [Polyangiaceae bacterium]|nr:pyridoxamine 5'-phosphate oxidase family protein [Polyangiaceae bacterium]